MSGRSRLGPAGLLGRQWASRPAASVIVAVLVFGSALVAAAAPRALDELFTDELRYTLAEVSSTERDLVATTVGTPLQPYSAMDDALDDLRSEMGDALAAATGSARYVSVSPPLGAIANVPPWDAPITLLALGGDPLVADVVTVANGSAPKPQPDIDFFAEGIGTLPVLQMMLSTTSATAMGWTVGEQRTIRGASGFVQVIELSGTFEAVDRDDDYWQHNPSIVDPNIFDDGNSTPTVTATGFVDPASLVYATRIMGGVSTTVWFPLDTGTATFAQSSELLQQLRKFTSGSQTVPVEPDSYALSSLNFSSGLVESLTTVADRASSTTAVIAMAAAGPLGVMLAVLALACRVVTERRRPGLALAAARGASPAQLRTITGIEGAILGVPAAVLATVVAAALLPAAVDWSAVVLPALLGLAPAGILAAGASGASLRTERSDLGTRPRFGWIVEVTVLGLAALAVFLLLSRGLTSNAGLGVDPLLAATPLLLSLAVCVIVLRLYPLPLGALERGLQRSPGLTAHLGAVRAVRDPAAGLAPVLALVVGVSVAVFSTILVATLSAGVDAAARGTVGADLQARGTEFTPTVIESIAAIDGVAATAGVDDAGPRILRVDGDRVTVTVLVVDAAALREVRGGGIPDLESGGDPIPVLASSDLEFDAGAELVLDGIPITIVDRADRTLGLTTTSSWIMVDAGSSDDLLGVGFRPRILLLDLDPSASVADVTAGIIDAAGQQVRVLDPEQAAETIRESPAVSGLQSALLFAIGFVALLGALTVVMTSVVGSRARNRLLALLSTLGASERDARGLAAWEIAPIALAAIISGTALGIALPFVVLAGVDLRPFTGGATQPAVSLDPLAIAAIVVGFAVLVAGAVLIAVAVSRRVSAASTLRMGEQ